MTKFLIIVLILLISVQATYAVCDIESCGGCTSPNEFCKGNYNGGPGAYAFCSTISNACCEFDGAPCAPEFTTIGAGIALAGAAGAIWYRRRKQ